MPVVTSAAARQDEMKPPELHIDKGRVKKLESFLNDPAYKEYLENAASFNRKLNEERKMRIPYIDGQTGVAQRHYDNQRSKRERMPPPDKWRRGGVKGQILCYPRKQWKKRSYQYLKFFMQPRGNRLGPTTGLYEEAEMCTISQIENPSLANATGGNSLGAENEVSMGSKEDTKQEWGFYDEDVFPEEHERHEGSDSDFEYEDYSSKKKKGKKGGGKAKGGAKSSGGGGGSAKRRTHADNIPDSEKPFSCELCGARYKTRPGLTYHFKNSHKDRDTSHMTGGVEEAIYEEDSATGGALSQPSATPPPQPLPPHSGPPQLLLAGGEAGDPNASGGGRQSSRRSTAVGVNYRESDLIFGGAQPPHPPHQHGPEASRHSPHGMHPPPPHPLQPPASLTAPLPTPMGASSVSSPSDGAVTARAGPPAVSGPGKTMSGKDRAPSLGYCDFCLGDANENKKTSQPEELVSCAECGRSGHPSCLQFTENMIISVREYPWQCIECKCCTLCGTSENDEELLFCDDCDRGYHMYCLVPPLKSPPEGSWSCKLCLKRFHKKG